MISHFAGILIPFIVGQTLTTESPTLYSGNLACSGDQITFVCETKGSSIIAWTSNEYIGQGGAQLQFAAAEVPSLANTLHGTGDTVATFTDNRVENRVQVLTSTLRVTASSVYPNPSVTCIHVDNDTRRTVSFSVIGKHIIASI